MAKDRYGVPYITDPKLVALKNEWYAKLERTGFVDIEPWKNLTKNSYLKDHHIETYKRALRGIQTGKAELFRLAYQWLDVARWRTRTERWAFAAWVAGWDFREVAARFAVGKHGAFAGRVRTQVRHMLAHFRAEEEFDDGDVEP